MIVVVVEGDAVVLMVSCVGMVVVNPGAIWRPLGHAQQAVHHHHLAVASICFARHASQPQIHQQFPLGTSAFKMHLLAR